MTVTTRPAQPISTALQTQLASGTLAGKWILDPDRSTARLRARHMWGLAPVNGHFRALSGDGTVSPSGEVTGRFAIATASVDTRNAQRDGHLRGTDFFLSEQYPEITFSLDALTPADQHVTVSG